MRIAVLGGGHGAHAAAADLSEQGHEVRFWRRDTAALQGLMEKGGLRLTDAAGSRDVSIRLVTPEVGQAVRDADLILMPGPAMAQVDIARAMAPHLSDGQGILMPPGSFGTWVVMDALRAEGCDADLLLGESGTLPWLARMQGPEEVAIVTRATRLPTGVFPLARADAAFGLFCRAFPSIERLTDALDGALMNAGPIIHPPLILMNAGPIEHFDHWDIHNEGTQPAIRRVTDALDAERVAVREALGYGAPHFPLADHYDDSRPEWMYGQAAHDRLVVSSRWRETLDLTTHRYMREDVAIGLAFLVSVARRVGVPVPVASGLLALAGAINGEDFLITGRTLESLGLGEMTPAALQARLRDGF
ncbi:MAG: NAD/NADP octopine/nopaline dehydrogenase family protein [Minwuia sp.]|nr:NAD/NADP octopine/nopaline dehydrogenase family protein [Minwuia sp.]